MVYRDISETVISVSKNYPVITITGPRQSGKTTLVKQLFPEYDYYTLEDPDIREIAQNDPRSFLAYGKTRMVLDEIQRTPELLSYLQGIVDNSGINGQYILTGSHQFDLLQSISQSLAGRTALINLLPFSFGETAHYMKDFETDDYLLHGFFPAVYERNLDPTFAYKNYFETYIQRDLRQLVNIKDLHMFQKFVRLCAGRTGSLLSMSSLSNDVGVSIPTIKTWISVLEASFIIFLLPPYFGNIGKRLIKSPKLYFYDTGLAAYLLGIENTKQLSRDPLRGNLFENMIIMEAVKNRFNRAFDHNMCFYRDSNNNEVDLLFKKRNEIVPVEIKSAATFNKEFLKGLHHIKKTMNGSISNGYVIYTGETLPQLNNISIINYKNLSAIFR